MREGILEIVPNLTEILMQKYKGVMFIPDYSQFSTIPKFRKHIKELAYAGREYDPVITKVILSPQNSTGDKILSIDSVKGLIDDIGSFGVSNTYHLFSSKVRSIPHRTIDESGNYANSDYFTKSFLVSLDSSSDVKESFLIVETDLQSKFFKIFGEKKLPAEELREACKSYEVGYPFQMNLGDNLFRFRFAEDAIRINGQNGPVLAQSDRFHLFKENERDYLSVQLPYLPEMIVMDRVFGFNFISPSEGKVYRQENRKL